MRFPRGFPEPPSGQGNGFVDTFRIAFRTWICREWSKSPRSLWATSRYSISQAMDYSISTSSAIRSLSRMPRDSMTCASEWIGLAEAEAVR